MSLTTFIEIKNVREKLKQEFLKPSLCIKKDLLAPPLNRYLLVGRAFDYLLRFYIKRLNPKAIQPTWIAERSCNILQTNLFQQTEVEIFIDEDKEDVKITEPPKHMQQLCKKAEKILLNAKQNYSMFIKNGNITKNLIKSSLLLAQLDSIYRAGVIDEDLGEVENKDIRDLENLIALVNPNDFKAKKICLLNPTFGRASTMVHGADMDLVIDDKMIEIKTTKYLKLPRRHFNQMIGYYTLYKISGIDGMSLKNEIKYFGIYFSRHGYLHFFKVNDLINKKTFPKFKKWFQDAAIKYYKN